MYINQNMGDIVAKVRQISGEIKTEVLFKEGEGGSQTVEKFSDVEITVALEENKNPAEMTIVVPGLISENEYKVTLGEDQEFEIPGLGNLNQVVIRHERG